MGSPRTRVRRLHLMHSRYHLVAVNCRGGRSMALHDDSLGRHFQLPMKCTWCDGLGSVRVVDPPNRQPFCSACHGTGKGLALPPLRPIDVGFSAGIGTGRQLPLREPPRVPPPCPACRGTVFGVSLPERPRFVRCSFCRGTGSK